jgi:hypothetical protein
VLQFLVDSYLYIDFLFQSISSLIYEFGKMFLFIFNSLVFFMAN